MRKQKEDELHNVISGNELKNTATKNFDLELIGAVVTFKDGRERALDVELLEFFLENNSWEPEGISNGR